jgi:large subunit ribosomal protein L35
MTKANKTKKYKLKTHSGAKARFWVTGNGKLMRRKIGVNNFRRKKRGETLRQMSGKVQLSPHQLKRLRKLLPYA